MNLLICRSFWQQQADRIEAALKYFEWLSKGRISAAQEQSSRIYLYEARIALRDALAEQQEAEKA